MGKEDVVDRSGRYCSAVPGSYHSCIIVDKKRPVFRWIIDAFIRALCLQPLDCGRSAALSVYSVLALVEGSLLVWSMTKHMPFALSPSRGGIFGIVGELRRITRAFSYMANGRHALHLVHLGYISIAPLSTSQSSKK